MHPERLSLPFFLPLSVLVLIILLVLLIFYTLLPPEGI